MGKKGGIQLSINTIVLLIIAIIALIIMVLILTGNMKEIIANISTKVKQVLGLWNATKIQ
ncbi:MAG: hypothetical protein N3G19_00345 [Candidatus Pacearchaeota archaeon]|nr:hypothetical protein [Candidatus Pacearchaeota archaeon]